MKIEVLPVVISDPNESAVQPIYNAPMTLAINKPEEFVFCQDPLNDLANSSSAIIHEKIECCKIVCNCLLKCLCGCCSCCCIDRTHTFNTFIRTNSGTKYLFKTVTSSTNKCLRPRRIFEDIHMRTYEVPSFEKFNENNLYCEVEKPLYDECCRCRLPPSFIINVNLIKQGIIAGKIKIPGDDSKCCECQKESNCDCDCGNCGKCCNIGYIFHILDGKGNLVYYICMNICQISLLTGCVNFCDIELQILETNGKLVGKITKLIAQSMGEFFTDSDSYEVKFPLEATPELKLTILLAAILIDSLFFN